MLLMNGSSGFAELRGTVSATSNYVGRGYTKSNDEFAFQANIDYEHEKGGYVGTHVSNVNFGDYEYDNAARVEIRPYLGWSFGLSDTWRIDLQWMRYLYDGKIFGNSADYNEFYFFLHYRDIFTAAVSFSEDYYNRGKASANYELTGRYPITDYLQISSIAGYSQTKSSLEYDYIYWNAGFTFFYKFVALDFRYVDSYEVGAEVNYVEDEEKHHSFEAPSLKPSFLFTLSLGF
jgi:uncharacterized protein (TIGR02001 family)